MELFALRLQAFKRIESLQTGCKKRIRRGSWLVHAVLASLLVSPSATWTTSDGTHRNSAVRALVVFSFIEFVRANHCEKAASAKRRQASSLC